MGVFVLVGLPETALTMADEGQEEQGISRQHVGEGVFKAD